MGRALRGSRGRYRSAVSSLTFTEFVEHIFDAFVKFGRRMKMAGTDRCGISAIDSPTYNRRLTVTTVICHVKKIEVIMYVLPRTTEAKDYRRCPKERRKNL